MTVLLETMDLRKHFPVRTEGLGKRPRWLKAVDGVSLTIEEGECLGLVGESGCGKTTFGRLLLRLIEPTEGEILFKGQPLLRFNKQEMKNFRRQAQIIFQDPYSSLNPRKTVGATIEEPFIIHNLGNGSERRQRVLELMNEVGLRAEHIDRYPHEFSGGQRQRIGIARALALNPDLIVADEPVSALDVSIQAQVVNLLKDLQAKFNLTYVFIAHDLSLVRHVAGRLAIMYLGRLVELVDRGLFGVGRHHPYTQALLASIPVPKPGVVNTTPPLTGDVPSPIDPPSGCPFHPRCPEVVDTCRIDVPPLKQIDTGQWAACHRR